MSSVHTNGLSRMTHLKEHNDKLRAQFENFVTNADSQPSRQKVCLDEIDVILRNSLKITEMREAGAFFTGQELSSILVSKFTTAITNNSVVYDPTCGAGNLLIECSRKLDVEKTLTATLSKWGQVLRGFDVHPSFVESAKLRIILEALNRGVRKNCTLDVALQKMSNICVADVMSLKKEQLKDATHIALNPPFSLWNSPDKGFWKKGKVNAAGIVCELIVCLLPPGCEMSAILPDVLRSGSRYIKWRDFISDFFFGEYIIYGRFNKKTDVDVFLLFGRKSLCKNETTVWSKSSDLSRSLADEFEVCIGPLVAYRDPKIGSLYPYIHPKNAPAWGIMNVFEEFRRYSGKVFTPPLVVVRRTSSPSDKNRAVGTIIQGEGPVAIENHMIVFQPKDGSFSSCEKLLKILSSPSINDILNDRIRLRHLTVGVVSQLPFIEEL